MLYLVLFPPCGGVTAWVGSSMVEHLTFNEVVPGSSPGRPTSSLLLFSPMKLIIRRWPLFLAFALLETAPAQAQTIVPSAPPDVPQLAMSADVSHLITQVQANREANKFAEALALLKTAPAASSADDAKALQLAAANTEFFWGRSLMTNAPAEALSHYSIALSIDRTLFPSQAACDLGDMGLAYQKVSQFDKAADASTQALALFQKSDPGNKNAQANTLMNLGITYISLAQYDKAETSLKQSLALFQQNADELGQANAFNNLGALSQSRRQFTQARNAFQSALPLMRRVKNEDGEASVLDNLGNVDYSLHQYREALDYQQQALSMMERLGDHGGKAKSLNNMGLAYMGLHQYDKALEKYQQALPLYQQVGNKDGEAIALANTGAAYAGLRQYVKAIALFQQALSIFREVGDKPGDALAVRNISLAQGRLKSR